MAQVYFHCCNTRDLLIAPLLLATAALFSLCPAAHAQTPYDYPWCAIYVSRPGVRACYYSSYDECMATMTGVRGRCVLSPYFRTGEPDGEHRGRRQ